MTEDKKISKTFTKLPTLSPSATTDGLFIDDKFSNPLSKKNSLATTQGFLSRRTTTELKTNLKTTDGSVRMPSPDNNLHLSKTITEEFDMPSTRNFVVSPHARSSETSGIHPIRKKVSPEHNVNDFYLRSLGQTKYTSNLTNSTTTKFYAPSSRNTHQSFYETGHISKGLSGEKKSVSTEGITQELALLANGKSPKRRFVDELNATLKFYFQDRKEFQRTFEDVDVANYCMEEVTERLKCYRPELGIIMEKILGLYKKIFRKFLDLAMKSEKQLVESTKTSSKETMETIERLKLEKLMADDKIKGYRKLFEAQETQAKIQEFNITSLQEEIQMLYSMVQKDQIPQTGRDEEEEANDKNRKMKYIKIATELEERVAYFQQSILNLEEEQSKKETSIKAMNHLIKAMLVSAKQDQATQVNESELLATVFELHYHDRPNITSDDVNLQAGSGVNIQPHLVSSLNHIDKIAGVDTSELNSLKDVQPSKDLTTERLLTEPQYGQKMTMADMKNLVQSISDNWNLPVNIVVFLENVTKNKDAAGVLPWNFFKKIIFDVYIDRLSQANEMQNNLVTTFVPTSEYLCLYFLRKFELRRTAELKMLEFLASLRYYSVHWQRALTFANLANICNLKYTANNMYTHMEKFDPYLQHYFYYCFSKVIADASLLFDTPEALTYYPKTKMEPLIDDCLFFLTEEQRKTFFNNNKKHIRFYTETEEGFDIDKLLHMFCEEYIEARARNINKISKTLASFFTDDKGETVLSLDEIITMIKTVLNNDTSPLPGYVYPQALSIARSYLFSLTSGKNSYSITINNLLTALARFGIDSPFPFINITKIPAGLTATSMTAIPEDVAYSPSRSGTISRKLPTKILPSRYSLNSNTPVPGQQGKSPKKTDEGQDSFEKHLDSSQGGERRRTAIKMIPSVPDVPHGLKIDGASMMFTQHFSILREMKNQIHQLNKLVKIEQERDVLMKHFEQVAHALESACQFLSFPISY